MGILYYIKELEAGDLNLIATALGKLPFESVAPLITKLKAQVAAIESEMAAETTAAAAKEAAAKEKATAPAASAPATPATATTPTVTPAATPTSATAAKAA